MVGHLFSFCGRLSRAAWRRSVWRNMSIGGVGIFAAIMLLMTDLPTTLSLTPLILVPVSAIALAAGWTRRLHDVGLHARHAVIEAVLGVVLFFAPIGIWLMLPDAPAWFGYNLIAWIGLGFVLSILLQIRRGPSLEYRRGDRGSNTFGPAPPPEDDWP